MTQEKREEGNHHQHHRRHRFNNTRLHQMFETYFQPAWNDGKLHYSYYYDRDRFEFEGSFTNGTTPPFFSLLHLPTFPRPFLPSFLRRYLCIFLLSFNILFPRSNMGAILEYGRSFVTLLQVHE
jgi:hypothetical protein